LNANIPSQPIPIQNAAFLALSQELSQSIIDVMQVTNQIQHCSKDVHVWKDAPLHAELFVHVALRQVDGTIVIQTPTADFENGLQDIVNCVYLVIAPTNFNQV
jgi:hypothetical protein